MPSSYLNHHPAIIKATIANDCKNILECINSNHDVNIRNRYLNTALHYAIFNKNIKIVSILINNGADPFIDSDNRISPILLSIMICDNEMLEILLKCSNKAAINKELTLNRNDYDTWLIFDQNSKYLENLIDKNNLRLLDFALNLGKYKCALLLIESGAFLNEQYLSPIFLIIDDKHLNNDEKLKLMQHLSGDSFSSFKLLVETLPSNNQNNCNISQYLRNFNIYQDTSATSNRIDELNEDLKLLILYNLLPDNILKQLNERSAYDRINFTYRIYNICKEINQSKITPKSTKVISWTTITEAFNAICCNSL